MKTVYLGLGSNLGDRKVNLRRALKLLPPAVKVEKLSPVYETRPLYISDQPMFYNVVLRAKTALSPEALLRHTQGVEAAMGREGKTHNRPRVIDIDILLYGDEQVKTPDLVIPHPRIAERAFVLKPLADIAPKLSILGAAADIATMLSSLGDTSADVRKTNVRL
jgi:2-amino-4-hydroxy-6-hydroxymethyldihydropteridine diphosphokinase